MGTPLLCTNLRSLRSLFEGLGRTFETAQPEIGECHGRHEAHPSSVRRGGLPIGRQSSAVAERPSPSLLPLLAHHTLGPPIFLRNHLPEGTQGGRGWRAVVNHSSACGSSPEISFRLQAQDFNRQLPYAIAMLRVRCNL